MIYGYARVSSKEQKLDRQYEALNKYKKMDRVYADKQSGKNFDREEYQKLKAEVRSGDEVVVKELDRFGRNKNEIKKELEWFSENGVTVRILDVPTTLIDFQGQDWIRDMVNNILIEVLGAISERERENTRRRQAEGIQAMKDRGDWDRYGRPSKKNGNFKKISEKQKRGEITVREACKELGISKATWYGWMKEASA